MAEAGAGQGATGCHDCTSDGADARLRMNGVLIDTNVLLDVATADDPGRRRDQTQLPWVRGIVGDGRFDRFAGSGRVIQIQQMLLRGRIGRGEENSTSTSEGVAESSLCETCSAF